jgi:hypothetical protein
MTNEEIFELHKLQSANVRKLTQVKDSLNKDINFYLRKSDHFQVELKTKLLALLYSAWSEAQFIQIVYTPSAFSWEEIRGIKKVAKDNGISHGWNEMINIATQKINNSAINFDLEAKTNEILGFIDEYINKPSKLRNKIGHGQWVHALKGSNTAEEPQLTTKLQQLDYVELMNLFEVHKYLGFIIRDLVQSPNKGFNKKCLSNIEKLKNYVNKTTSWNKETKKLILKPIVPINRESQPLV